MIKKIGGSGLKGMKKNKKRGGGKRVARKMITPLGRNIRHMIEARTSRGGASSKRWRHPRGRILGTYSRTSRKKGGDKLDAFRSGGLKRRLDAAKKKTGALSIKMGGVATELKSASDQREMEKNETTVVEGAKWPEFAQGSYSGPTDSMKREGKGR